MEALARELHFLSSIFFLYIYMGGVWTTRKCDPYTTFLKGQNRANTCQKYTESIISHSGFFPHFCFTSKHKAFISLVVKVIFRRGQLMIWHQKWCFSLLYLPYLITFNAKSSIVPCKKSLLGLIKWTLTVSKQTKILKKIHCAPWWTYLVNLSP